MSHHQSASEPTRFPENTDLADVPREWIDPRTLPYAGEAQELANDGLLPDDTDADGVTDLGELRAGTDPLDPENRNLPVYSPDGYALDYQDDVEDIV